MAAQAALIADTIAGMKKVTREIHHAASDSDDGPTSLVTNRGQKLKRRAQYIHEGQLDGQRPYKKRIEHSGYHRYILTRKPKRYDVWGDELDAEEQDEEADQEAAEVYPYNDIHIEKLLRPLTDATQLPAHPTLSIPYKSSILPDMVQQAEDVLHRERHTLWSIKHLLINFRGDSSWTPGNAVWSENDNDLFPIDAIRNEIIGSSKAPLIYETITVESPQKDGMRITSHAFEYKGGLGITDGFVDSRSIERSRSDDPHTKLHGAAHPGVDSIQAIASVVTNTKSTPDRNELGLLSPKLRPSNQLDLGPDLPASIRSHQEIKHLGLSEEPLETQDQIPEQDADESGHRFPRRMTTRAQALATSDAGLSNHTRSPSPASSLPNYIHPLYIIPSSAIPDRDLGLAANEAEDIRRLLMAWVQKQEEVCRGAERFHESLTKANSMRETVFAWCKAEAHIGEMSDGEDWFDMEEWGLNEELKKGQMEEDDEVMNAGKKTRGRRAAA